MLNQTNSTPNGSRRPRPVTHSAQTANFPYILRSNPEKVTLPLSHALSVLQRRQGEPEGHRLAHLRRGEVDPPAARMPALREAVHHLRADRGAHAADRREEGRPARAVGPEQD